MIALALPVAVMLSGLAVTVYDVMPLAPLTTGAENATVASPLPAVAVAIVGAVGSAAAGSGLIRPIDVAARPTRAVRSGGSATARCAVVVTLRAGVPARIFRRTDAAAGRAARREQGGAISHQSTAAALGADHDR